MPSIIYTLCPASLMFVLEVFRPCFSKKAFFRFCVLVLGWCTCFGRHSISRILQASGIIDAGWHHAAFYRFLSQAQWTTDSLGKLIFQMLLPLLPPEIELPIDDTLHRRCGPHIFGAAMHYDAKNSSYGRNTSKARHTSFAFGHSWVVLSVWLPIPWTSQGGFALPVLFRLYRSLKTCPADLYQKRTELALEMVTTLASWLQREPTRSLLILGDSEYCCQTLLKNRPPRTHLAGPIPLDAAVFAQPEKHRGRGRPRKKGPRLPSPKQMATDPSHPWSEAILNIYGKQVRCQYKTVCALWYGSAGDKLGRVIVTHDPKGEFEDRAYFCTDPERSPESVLVSYSHRWPVEVAFRDAKQLLGIEDPQNGWWRRPSNSPSAPKQAGPNPHPVRGQKAVSRTFPLGFLCYDIVIIWYLLNASPESELKSARKSSPWYTKKTDIAFSDMLAALRAEIWATRIFTDPTLRRVRKKLLAKLPTWLWYT